MISLRYIQIPDSKGFRQDIQRIGLRIPQVCLLFEYAYNLTLLTAR